MVLHAKRLAKEGFGHGDVMLLGQLTPGLIMSRTRIGNHTIQVKDGPVAFMRYHNQTSQILTACPGEVNESRVVGTNTILFIIFLLITGISFH